MKSRILYILFLALLFGSCRTTKYVAEDEYLLRDYSIKTEGDKLDKDEIHNYIKQKPNRTILGMPFHLGLYSLSNKNKENGFNNWLRRIGEKPVIYDEFVKDKTTSQLKLYLKNKGYYNAVIEDTVYLKKKKAKIEYNIRSNAPYRIRNLIYYLEDTTLTSLVSEGNKNSLLKKGELFDVDLLANERQRIENLARSKGFYYFNKKYIFFRVDSSLNNKEVDLEMVIQKYKETDAGGNLKELPHPMVRIRNVYFHTNYNSQLALSDFSAYSSGLDTLNLDSMKIIYNDFRNIKPTIVTESNYILPGELYNSDDVTRTYRNMTSLSAFRLVNINFLETGQISSSGERILDCEIHLTPSSLQSYAIELTGTNSFGNLGAAGNLNYQHKNLFKGSENLDIRLLGSLETLSESSTSFSGNMLEIGTELSIRFPKFILPFKSDKFIKEYNPSTSISLSYNYQQEPRYTGTFANAAFGYKWKGNKHLTHLLNPIEVNLVKIPFKSQDFIDWLEGKYLFYSFQPHLVTVSNYSLIFNNQNIRKKSDFFYVRFNIESAGNLLALGYDLSNAVPSESGNYELFNLEYAQYILGDIDFRFYNNLNQNNSLVYRIFAGAGLPYNNSTALPFEKKYFSGGANSIRAWQPRNLGPGSYDEPSTDFFPNITGDIKLEANIEYRFKLFWLLEGALFVDAGNIWAINSNDEREGALFDNEFYKDIAVGTGFGTRFDFNFFVFRIDLGIKVRDPALSDGDKWIIGNRKLEREDFVFNLGIGYPF